MANAFDRFAGGAVSLASHTPDSAGDTWNAGTANVFVGAAGSLYGGAGTFADGTLISWTPPSADYSAEVVIGADWITGPGAGGYTGIILRGSGADGAKTIYYVLFTGPPTSTPVQFLFGKAIAGGAGILIGAAQNFPSPVVAGDVLRYSVSGTGATVTLAFYRNGTLLYTIGDSDSNRIVTTGKAGIFVLTNTPSNQDQIRAFWAGPLAGPTNTITPSAPTVTTGATQGFTAAVVETNETINWTTSAGSCSPTTGATTTWTAPGSGTSATVTWTSGDLPDRTATATVTLSSAAGATAFAVTGPSSGFKLNASTAFTFTPNGVYTGTITFTMPGLAGTWAPTSRTWTASGAGQTATFTPSALGTGTVTGTGAPVLTQSASPTYTANAQTLGVTPGALPTSATTPEIFYGGGTLWLTSAPTFTPSGSVAGVTCGAVTVISNTEAHANITTGTATGTFLWTDSTTGATASEVVANIANVLSIGEGFATGLTTVGYAVYDAAGTLLSAWTASGVSERGTNSGDYGAVVAIVQDGADYEIRWSQTSGTTPPFVHDVRRAAASSSAGVTVAANGLDAVIVESGINLRQATALALAALAGKASGLQANTPVFKGAGTNTTRISATTDANGNRPTVTLTPPA